MTIDTKKLRIEFDAYVGGVSRYTAITLLDEIERLGTRQQELLATIVKVTNTTPFADEAADALKQRGALVAEIGTLRAEVEAHRRTLDEKLGAWQVSKELGDARWEVRRLTEQLAAMTAARDELADIAEQHIFVPTGNAVACAPQPPQYQTFAAAQPFHQAAAAQPQTFNLELNNAYAMAACAPAPTFEGQLIIDTGKPYRDKARVKELRKVGEKP